MYGVTSALKESKLDEPASEKLHQWIYENKVCKHTISSTLSTESSMCIVLLRKQWSFGGRHLLNILKMLPKIVYNR